MKVEKLEETIEIPEKIEVSVNGSEVSVKGTKGQVVRDFKSPKIKIEKENNVIKIFATKATKREKKLILSFIAHIKNMFKGVENLHRYELKICSGHFPMSVDMKGKELIVKNFLGEKIPRKVSLTDSDISVKVDGNMIFVESIDIEKAGYTATKIEQLTRITDRDSRVFQDGIYITKKAKDFD